MNTSLIPFPMRSLRMHRGVSLIIVLIMLVIIGLTSAAAIRNATSGEKAGNNIRLQNLAQQYAEAALRYCEAELRKPNGVAAPVGRGGTRLVDANITTTAVGAAMGDTFWGKSATWIGVAPAASTRTVVPESQIKSDASAFKPSKLPECVVETQVMPGIVPARLAHVVTARGFSPDYTADAETGQTTNGSVVWLQSTILLN